METRDLPQGIVGFGFAQALLDGEYDMAHEMLSAELKVEYAVQALKQRFVDMISRADEPSELPDIEVMNNSELGNGSGDQEGFAYVAIWSEAVAVTVRPFGSKHLITELVWGRP
jgi:hypothetical protein